MPALQTATIPVEAKNIQAKRLHCSDIHTVRWRLTDKEGESTQALESLNKMDQG